MEFIILLCDTRPAAEQPQSLTTTLVSEPRGYNFLNAMERKKVGSKHFRLYSKGIDTYIMVENQGRSNSPNDHTDLSTSRPKPIAYLNRNEKRTRFSDGLRTLWNIYRPEHSAFARLPVLPWDSLLESMELMFVLPDGYSMSDLYEALSRKSEATNRLPTMLNELENGNISLRRRLAVSQSREAFNQGTTAENSASGNLPLQP